MRTAWLIPLTLVAACGGATERSDGDGNGAIGACDDCAEPSPSPAPSEPSEPDDPPAQSGIAILERDIPAFDEPYGGSGGGSGGGLDPDTLHIMIGTSGASCSDPRASTDCTEWKVNLPLSPSLQHTGTIPLSEIYAYFLASGEPYTPGTSDCPGGGGSFADGTLTIHSIDATKVVFSLHGTWAFDIAADGTYEVLRCPSS